MESESDIIELLRVQIKDHTPDERITKGSDYRERIRLTPDKSLFARFNIGIDHLSTISGKMAGYCSRCIRKMKLETNDICWVILAGGRASRMGGNDKGLILLDGKPLIEIVYNAVSLQSETIYINANRNIARYKNYAPVIQDKIPDFQGPLAGIESCLSEIDAEWIGFTPCDSPNIPKDLISRLCQHRSDDIDVIVAHDGEFPQPVFSLWNRKSHAKLTEFLERGDRKIKMLLRECNTVYADFSDIPETFINLNTPEELSRFGTDND